MIEEAIKYCNQCGEGIVWKRTKNEKWMPCNAFTGEPHFCNKTKKETGLKLCPRCGRALIPVVKNNIKVWLDYNSLQEHFCNKADITRYKKRSQRK